MSSIVKKIIILVVLLAIGGGAYYFYKKSNISFSELSLSAKNVSLPINNLVLPDDSAPVGTDILILANKIKTVTIDPSVFSSPLFAYLKDFSNPLTPEAQGRPNPFAPIGLDVSSIVVPASVRTATSVPKPNGI